MKQGTRGKRGGRSKRKEWVTGNGLMACLIVLLLRIPLGHIIGDKGLGFLAAGIEVFTAVGITISYGFSKAVAVMVKYRIKREQFRSARQVYKIGMLLASVSGAAAAAAIFFGAEWIAGTVIAEHKGYLAIAAAAPAVCFSAVLGVLRGYFQGMGRMAPILHSRALEKLMMAAACLIGASMMHRYGLKVAALLKAEEYAGAYGAMGAVLGISAACALAVLHLVLIHMVYGASFRKQLLQDSTKNQETGGRVAAILLSTALPYLLCALLYHINGLADQSIFYHVMHVKNSGGSGAALWGVYYGKYSVMIGVSALLCARVCVPGLSGIVQSFEREDGGEVRRRMNRSIHALAVFSVPAAVLTAVLAEPAAGLLFSGDRATAVRMIQAGSGVIVFFSFSYFFMGILQRIRKIWLVIPGALAAFLLHLAVLALLLNYTGLGILAVVAGTLVFWLANCIFSWATVARITKYRQEWIRTLGITVIAAGVSGAVGMLLSGLLLKAAGNLVTLLVCLTSCLILYLLVLVMLKGLNKEELEEMPGGKAVIAIAERLRLM